MWPLYIDQSPKDLTNEEKCQNQTLWSHLTGSKIDLTSTKKASGVDK